MDDVTSGPAAFCFAKAECSSHCHCASFWRPPHLCSPAPFLSENGQALVSKSACSKDLVTFNCLFGDDLSNRSIPCMYFLFCLLDGKEAVCELWPNSSCVASCRVLATSSEASGTGQCQRQTLIYLVHYPDSVGQFPCSYDIWEGQDLRKGEKQDANWGYA